MTNPRAESIAFQQALLKSERLRIRIVLGAIIVAFLLRTIRASFLGGRENFVSWLMMLGLLGLFVACELMMLHAVNSAIQRVRQLAIGYGSATYSWKLSCRLLPSRFCLVHPSIQFIDHWQTRRALPFLCLSAFPRSA